MLPAEAESYKVETIAQGRRTQTIEVARAEADRIRKIGESEAVSVELVGKAEAEQMRLKAAAYRQYGEAAIMAMVLESLPQVRFVILSFIKRCVLINTRWSSGN